MVGEDSSQQDRAFKISKLPVDSNRNDIVLSFVIVKFDTDKLPPILNALETMNGEQKLVLEVAVRLPRMSLHMRVHLLIEVIATFG